MKNFDCYGYIKNEIEITRIALDGLNSEYTNVYNILKANRPKDLEEINYKDFNNNRYVPIETDRIIKKLHEINEYIHLYNDRLKHLTELSRNLEKTINSYEGIYYKVAYLKYIQGLSLKEISCKTHMSYSRIRHIHSKLNKLHQTP